MVATIEDKGVETMVNNDANTNFVTAEQNQRHILAERFKTKFCSKYDEYKSCPYEDRCMFAHGEEDLRTYEDNIRDGIYTEEAILSWQRAQRLVSCARSRQDSGNCSDRSMNKCPTHMLPPPPPPPPPPAWHMMPPPSYDVAVSDQYLANSEGFYDYQDCQYFNDMYCDEFPIIYTNKAVSYSNSLISNIDGLSDNSAETSTIQQTEFCGLTNNLVMENKKSRRKCHNPYNTAGLFAVPAIQTRTMRLTEQYM